MFRAKEAYGGVADTIVREGVKRLYEDLLSDFLLLEAFLSSLVF